MQEFFEWITTFFSDIANWIIGMVEATIQLFALIIKGISMYMAAITSVPQWLYPYAFATLIVGAVYLVVGRGGNGGN